MRQSRSYSRRRERKNSSCVFGFCPSFWRQGVRKQIYGNCILQTDVCGKTPLLYNFGALSVYFFIYKTSKISVSNLRTEFSLTSLKVSQMKRSCETQTHIVKNYKITPLLSICNNKSQLGGENECRQNTGGRNKPTQGHQVGFKNQCAIMAS